MKFKDKIVSIWLGLLCLNVLLILFIGGLTRLTHSGLSMVDWNPIMGLIPPLTTSDWLNTFSRYQEFPEFKLVNQGMSLAEFKSIFFWEYLHRVLGRMVGVVFIIPWTIFLWKKWINPRFAVISLIGFFLGGAQGLLGWYMVKSGLIHQPNVSHFRLAAHLSLAIFIYSFFYWLLLARLAPRKGKTTQSLGPLLKLSLLTTTLIAIQIVYGAFVAGLRAGKIYNTFPKMNGHWFPPEGLQLQPTWINWINNMATVQFSHRTLAWIVVLSVILIVFVWHRKYRQIPIQQALSLLIGALTFQFYLGVYTLLYKAPIALASIHQLGAILLLSTALFLNYQLLHPPELKTDAEFKK